MHPRISTVTVSFPGAGIVRLTYKPIIHFIFSIFSATSQP